MKLILMTILIVFFVGITCVSGGRNQQKRFSQVARSKKRNMCLLVHSTEDKECMGWDVDNWDGVGKEIADYVSVLFNDALLGDQDAVDVEKN